jgi:peptidyl-Lys metalloendopeptidase
MRRLMVVVAALAGLWAGAAQALSFDRCDKREIAIITDAVKGAQIMATEAAAAVADTPDYARWFGQFSPANAEIVRTNIKALDLVLQSNAVKLICANDGEEDCKSDTYANVWPDQPFVVNLCPAFFGMPTMETMEPGSFEAENGTREGTIIHELTHFTVIAGTDDECYTREVCSNMARSDARRAVRNADSYQYFAEDVMLSKAE